MDRSRARRTSPGAPRRNPTPVIFITVVALLIAGTFAVLAFRDRRDSTSNAPSPTAQAVVVPATTTPTPVVAASAPAPTRPAATAAVAKAASIDPTSPPSYNQGNDANVEAAVNSLIDGYDGIYGILMTTSTGEVLYSKNSETPFVTASLYKLVLLSDLYRKIEAGTITKTQELPVLDSDFDSANGEDSYFTPDNAGTSFSVDTLLFAAGAYSSNVAAKMLLTLTTRESLVNEAALLGMNNTHLFVKINQIANWPPVAAPDSSDAEVATAIAFDATDAGTETTNLTTPADMARYFQLLLQGKIVSQTASAEILGILKTQMVDDRFPVLLPSDAEMAHKTGNLDHVVHDVGIIYSPTGPVVLVAMVEADSDDNIPTEVEQRLALIAYGDFDVPAIDYVNESDTSATPSDGA